MTTRQFAEVITERDKMARLKWERLLDHVKTVIHFVAGSRKGSVMTADTPTKIKAENLQM
jgi:hypothetical protein